MNKTKNMCFTDLGITQKINDLLVKKNIVTPTPIQEKCIPLALAGRDIIGVAQTGTGKTFAFGLPVLEHIIKKNEPALIVLPTRELATQVHDELLPLARTLAIRSALLIGGEPAFKQRKKLKNNPQLIIATPGRLIDHIEKGDCSISKTKILVLDEADRMLDIGFMPQLIKIFKLLPKQRQTLLFSATMSKDILGITNQYMTDQVKIEVTPQGTSAQNILQKGLVISSNKKYDILHEFLTENNEKTLVFTRTKAKARVTTKKLRQANIKATEMHSNKSLSQRKKSLNDFKKGNCNVLVATDVAARGIHVDDIKHVINYDLPDSLEDYVHRIGRTGRAGSTGNALSFIEPDQQGKLRKIEKIIDKKIILLENSENFTSSPEKPTKKRRNGRGAKNRNYKGSNHRNRNYKKKKEL